MKDFLIEFWYFAAGIAVSIGVSAAAIHYFFRKSDSLMIFLFDILVFCALFSWLGSYALATRLEIESIDMSFPGDQLTGPDISAAFHAVGLAIAFGLLLVFHRYPMIVALLIIGVGITDWSGNSILIQSMREKAVAVGGARNLSPPQMIWHDYYVRGDHLVRITDYLLLSFASIIAYLLSNIKYFRVDVLRQNFGPGLSSAFRRLGSYRILFASAARIMIVSAIFMNEYWIWTIRLQREEHLSCYQSSFFYQWSLHSATDEFDCDKAYKKYGVHTKESPNRWGFQDFN